MTEKIDRNQQKKGDSVLTKVMGMRIITRPDFDGVVCAMLLFEAENIDKPIKWVQPNDIRKGYVQIQESDIIANLPYDKQCGLWFDHHCSNQIDQTFNGAFKITPSAARVIFEYYRARIRYDHDELIRETDKIDSANLSIQEVLNPENHAYFLLSMTVSDREESDERYRNKLVGLLTISDIGRVLKDVEVKKRCRRVVEQNKVYKILLKKHTVLRGHVSITDFRYLYSTPEGNRFLVFSMFPEALVNMKISHIYDDKDNVRVSVGHNIFNRNCNVNIGLMLSQFEGGGHRGAGGCIFHVNKTNEYIPQIIDILLKNKANEK